MYIPMKYACTYFWISLYLLTTLVYGEEFVEDTGTKSVIKNLVTSQENKPCFSWYVIQHPLHGFVSFACL